MSARKARKIDLTVYLAKEEFSAADEVLKPTAARSKISVELNSQQLGSLFLMQNKSTPRDGRNSSIKSL